MEDLNVKKYNGTIIITLGFDENQQPWYCGYVGNYTFITYSDLVALSKKYNGNVPDSELDYHTHSISAAGKSSFKDFGFEELTPEELLEYPPVKFEPITVNKITFASPKVKTEVEFDF